jgi:hypothetical protein
MGRMVLRVRRGTEKGKAHIFIKTATDDAYYAVCSSQISYDRVEPGKLKDVDCKRCRNLYNPGNHLMS